MKAEYKNIARRQKYWSSLAKKDAEYSKMMARKMRRLGRKIEARDYEREKRVGLLWARKRMKMARKCERMARK